MQLLLPAYLQRIRDDKGDGIWCVISKILLPFVQITFHALNLEYQSFAFFHHRIKSRFIFLFSELDIL